MSFSRHTKPQNSRAPIETHIQLFCNKDSSALSYYLKAIQIQERKNTKKDLLKSYNNLGVLYINLSQTDKAIYYFEKAAQIAHETEQPIIEGSIKHNIAMFYIGLGNYTKAHELLNQ